MVIERRLAAQRLADALDRAPVVVLTGPRQAGKTTLARLLVDAPKANFIDLEDPRDDARLGQPTLTLQGLGGTIVIDEAQRRRDLFPVLRVLVDENRRNGRFLVLGSASPDLVGLTADSLAGRVTLVELTGLLVADVGSNNIDGLWRRGGLPPSFLASTETESVKWRDDYVRTFLERDLGNLGSRVPATTMRRFWTMLAHLHGQLFNGAELARSLAISQPTVRRYLDALTDALVIRQLPPWHANISKRQLRAPKIYIRDTGLLHRLLGIDDHQSLLSHPKLGASWEGFVIEQFIARNELYNVHFWGTHGGAEIDLVFEVNGQRIGIEVKRTDAPRITPSMRIAKDDLGLDRILVAHAGTNRFLLAQDIEAIGAAELLTGGCAA